MFSWFRQKPVPEEATTFASDQNWVKDPMLHRRELLLGLPINDETAKATIAKLLFLQTQNTSRTATLYINSPGGSISSAFAITDTLMSMKMPVATIGLNEIHGMALVILACGERGRRSVLENSSLSLVPSFSASDNIDKSDFLRRMDQRVVTILTSTTRLTPDEAGYALATGRHFSALEALEAGIVDSITPCL